MCERGQARDVYLINNLIPVSVDSCIAGLLQTLNQCGYPTVASCCGHGHRPGNIVLKDGRELFIVADFEAARKLDALYPIDINGEQAGTK